VQKSAMPKERRAKRRALRSALRRRAAQTRLVTSVRRRPRSLASHLLAAGVEREVASGAANGLRTVAKRLNVVPAATGLTRRTVNGGRGPLRTVARYSRAQLVALMATYRPRKSEYIAARALVLGLAA